MSFNLEQTLSISSFGMPQSQFWHSPLGIFSCYNPIVIPLENVPVAFPPLAPSPAHLGFLLITPPVDVNPYPSNSVDNSSMICPIKVT